jgi:methylenetetrahydromethanopterin dehydrogenase
MDQIVIGFAKVGNIGSAPLIEFILDERAEREDIDVLVFGSGSKLTPKHASDIAEKVVEPKPNLIILTTPNASLPAPMKIMEKFKEKGIPAVVVSDSPAKKALEKIEELGIGYIIVESDAMIGARKEFLDAVEMSLFNADVIRVLSITGVFNILMNEIDTLVESLKKGKTLSLPKIVVNSEVSVSAANFQNPYAKAKAAAAFEMAEKVGKLSVEGCFRQKDWKQYITTVATAHELMRMAANLADEAREIEKSNDAVFRNPHSKDGTRSEKRKLMEKPK